MSLRDESRKEYLLRGESARTDELRTGALQRIAALQGVITRMKKARQQAQEVAR